MEWPMGQSTTTATTTTTQKSKQTASQLEATADISWQVWPVCFSTTPNSVWATTITTTTFTPTTTSTTCHWVLWLLLCLKQFFIRVSLVAKGGSQIAFKILLTKPPPKPRKLSWHLFSLASSNGLKSYWRSFSKIHIFYKILVHMLYSQNLKLLYLW